MPGATCCVIWSIGYGLKVCARRQIGFRIVISFGRSGSSNASMRVASEVSLKMNTGVLYLRAMRAASIAM